MERLPGKLYSNISGRWAAAIPPRAAAAAAADASSARRCRRSCLRTGLLLLALEQGQQGHTGHLDDLRGDKRSETGWLGVDTTTRLQGPWN